MKFKTYIAVILLGILATSCNDFLDPEPSSAITSNNYYSTLAELETGLIGAYDAIQGVGDFDKDVNHGIQYEFYITEMRSGNTATKIADPDDFSDAGQFESFNVLPINGLVANYYDSYYEVIYRTNVVLDNLGNVSDDTSMIEAEAKFIRAYAYFNLVRLFGDVPLVDHVLSPLESDAQFTRVDTSIIYDLIISDLITAEENLDNTYKTRASKAAAQGLLAKVYLTLENPEYTKAQIMCEKIINDGSFSLVDFYDVFYTELNEEIIFAIGFNSLNDSQTFSSQFMNSVGPSSGVNYATYDLVDDINEFGGIRAQYSFRQDPNHLTSVRYQCAKYFPDGDDGGTSNPHVFEISANPRLAGNDWIVLRYADVLLMHVEAIMGGANETSAGAALSSFQQVRDRAGLTDLVTEISVDDLLMERRVELAFENHRLFDLIRLGRAESVLSQYSTANNFGFTATDLLLPMPQNEVNLSDGLMTQNPGY
ncbi:RagB/SusD family nutrient uptake outer membrane protein [Winogradskyella litoriviva]|uniref:RagB/SusD family nutrient uptake outer membrane protein n=1 Tax=Winogradskyella litoriviva TaxID=1220182 RepID=A0ABX2E8D3_9FLAO|nr:RagB/SusD family nutrient uptake outer membrane protein [Winogradskyella litoriviva]NRD24417.1 RagB/SusD family nutrient uptake outer membrane protein [Winogradskyella litoriviva]